VVPRSYLQPVARQTPARDDLLDPSEWPIYQQDLVDAFFTATLARAGPSGAGTARSAIKAHLVPWLEQRSKYVWEATYADADEFAVALRTQLRPTTASGYLAVAAWFYDWLCDRHGLELRRRLGVTLVDPIDRFSRGARPSRDEQLVPVPREEAIAFFLAYAKAAVTSACSDVKWYQAARNYTLWLVANWAGLRRAELLALAGADVDLDTGLITVRAGKGGKGRMVHIQPPLVRTLMWYLDDVRPQGSTRRSDEPLFVSCRRRRFSEGGLATLLEREQDRAGLALEDRFSLHGLRRAFATRLYKQLRTERVRDPLVYVQYELGHRYLSTTQHYCQLDDAYRATLAREAGVALVNRYRRRSL